MEMNREGLLERTNRATLSHDLFFDLDSVRRGGI